MLKIRFPNGHTITYNTANYLVSGTEWSLYTKEDGQWVCSFPASAGVIVEAIEPCVTENPLKEEIENLLSRYRKALIEEIEGKAPEAILYGIDGH